MPCPVTTCPFGRAPTISRLTISLQGLAMPVLVCLPSNIKMRAEMGGTAGQCFSTGNANTGKILPPTSQCKHIHIHTGMYICMHTPIQNKLWVRDKAIWVSIMLWWQNLEHHSLLKLFTGLCHSGKPQQQHPELLLPACEALLHVRESNQQPCTPSVKDTADGLIGLSLKEKKKILSQQCILPKISRGKRDEGR